MNTRDGGWCVDPESCIDRNMGLVINVLKQWQRDTKERAPTREQLEQAGRRGLFDAWLKYPELADRVAFSTVATKAILSRMRACFRTDDGLRRDLDGNRRRLYRTLQDAEQALTHELGRPPRPEEIAERAACQFDEVEKFLEWKTMWRPISLETRTDELEGEPIRETFADPCQLAPDQRAGVAEERERIAKIPALFASAGLTEEEQEILALRWGLDQSGVPRPRRRVAELLLTRSNVAADGAESRSKKSIDKRAHALAETIRLIECRASRKLAQVHKNRGMSNVEGSSRRGGE